MKRTPLRRVSEKRKNLLGYVFSTLRNYSQVRRCNTARKARLRAVQFGEKRAWIVTLPCAVWNCQHEGYPIEPAHVKSRGAGGTSVDLVPICSVHHNEQHAVGISTFENRHDIDLSELAAQLETEWQEYQA